MRDCQHSKKENATTKDSEALNSKHLVFHLDNIEYTLCRIQVDRSILTNLGVNAPSTFCTMKYGSAKTKLERGVPCQLTRMEIMEKNSPLYPV